MSDSTSRDDAKLDETLEETFPASDPPANTVETGIRTGAPTRTAIDAVTDNRALNQFELQVNGGTAFLQYERTDRALTLIHTEVPLAARGHHAGETLVEAALQAGRSEGLRIIVVCPFARAYLRKHPGAKG